MAQVQAQTEKEFKMFQSNFYSVTFLVIMVISSLSFKAAHPPIVVTNSCPGRNNTKFITSEPLLNSHT